MTRAYRELIARASTDLWRLTLEAGETHPPSALAILNQCWPRLLDLGDHDPKLAFPNAVVRPFNRHGENEAGPAASHLGDPPFGGVQVSLALKGGGSLAP